MLNKEFGGNVHPKEAREDGQFTITIDTNCSLFRYDSCNSDENPVFLYYKMVHLCTNPFKYSLKVPKERAECIADSWRQY